MKKILTILVLFLLMFGNNAKACSDAGVASASSDSVCYNVPVTLSLNGFLGTIFQWQSLNNGIWVNETGLGATTPGYTVTLATSTKYRAIVTEVG
ncbi:MAG: hypothetical protein ACKPB3_10960, partial [Bacteroidota bacterium]